MEDKKYQVFVSSTYEDLQAERSEVIKGLLDVDCIPCGMEYFPAANTDSWSYIERLIKQCDYYVVIVAGKYGSVDDNGISYTQKEYQCAMANGIPVLAFVHSDSGNLPEAKREEDGQRREKLKSFVALVKKKMCKFWSTKEELRAEVIESLHKLMRSTPRPGWVRADAAANESFELENRISQLMGLHGKDNPWMQGVAKQDAAALDVEVKLQAYNRTDTGTPLLSFDVQTENQVIRNAFKTIIVCLGLKNNSLKGIKDVKCELEAESDVGLIVADTLFIENDVPSALLCHHVIDPKSTADVQLRPQEYCERFATFYIRPEGSGMVNWKIKVLNSISPVTESVETQIQSIPIPLSRWAEQLIESVWNHAKNHAGMLSFLIKTARDAVALDTVDWGAVFSDYIEKEWRRLYGD